MKSSVKEIVEKIPDFDDFLDLAEKIREVSLEKLLLEKELKSKESEIFREAMVNEKYYVKGKPPAISYVESAYKFSGFDNELLEARERFAVLTAELDNLRLQMSIYKDMIGVFQTLSANERGVSI